MVNAIPFCLKKKTTKQFVLEQFVYEDFVDNIIGDAYEI